MTYSIKKVSLFELAYRREAARKESVEIIERLDRYGLTNESIEATELRTKLDRLNRKISQCWHDWNAFCNTGECAESSFFSEKLIEVFSVLRILSEVLNIWKSLFLK